MSIAVSLAPAPTPVRIQVPTLAPAPERRGGPASICRDHHRRIGRPARMRLTRRGRLVASLGGLLAATVLALAAALGGAVSATATAVPGQAPEGWSSHVVQPGDTLWSLATEVAGGGDPRPVLTEIRQANGLMDSRLRAGQVLALPPA